MTATLSSEFRRWLAANHLDLTTVMPHDVWWFISVKGERYRTIPDARRRWLQLLPHLDSLWRDGTLGFDPAVFSSAPPPPPGHHDPFSGSTSDPVFRWRTQDWRPFRRRKPRQRRAYSRRAQLPEPAQRFLAFLGPTRKPSTINGYASFLARLHERLGARSLAKLNRRDLEGWFQALHSDGLHPSTRLSLIIQTRTYLRWAHDEGLISLDPDHLVRRSDFPKLPQYLPRPLPPDVDRELQARLAAGDTHHRALLLMRRTGLRIGELRRLEHHCLRTDPKGRRYLKVPLGKLDTERLVPLDDDTFAILRRLQLEGLPRPLLLGGTPDRPSPLDRYHKALAQAAIGLTDSAPITSHRLRHTYATSLLAGGMSLVALMRILGHRDHRMTLRYAAVTDDLVVREYHLALAKLAARYSNLPAASAPASELSPSSLLADLARWVKTSHADPRTRHALVIRIDRLIAALRDLE